MKFNIVSDTQIIIFLNKNYVSDINFKDKDELEDYFRFLFLNLKKNYNINFSGYYIINVYLDKYYGSVIELEKEEFEYYDSFTNQVDMRISVIDSNFLYEIEDPYFLDNLDNFKIYTYKNKFYLQIEKDISNIQISNIVEHSNIVYSDTEDIIYKSELVTI
ncbi:MAG: hypothetical protein IJ134_04840 [Bacilli bacterium]|nr:hypothetical protein [Bacilli bacterium]